MAKYYVGQKVLYWGRFGSAKKPVVTKITGVSSKDGKRVYDVSNGHWGYSMQFRKLPRKPRM